MTLSILHAPKNIAGQASIISRAQRRWGLKSDVLVFKKEYMDYECDKNLNLQDRNLLLWPFILFKNFLQCLDYDVYHFHYGWSLLPLNIDIIFLRLMGKKVVMQYWGSDCYTKKLLEEYTDFTSDQVSMIYPKLNDKIRALKLKWLKLLCNCNVVGDYALLPFVPWAKVVRQAIDVENLKFVLARKIKKLVIVHAPSSRDIKGTKFILEALKSLKFDFDFVLVEGKTNAEARKIFAKADVVIDDVLMGPLGILDIECMAMGKPVLVRVDLKLKKYYPGLPIINTPKNRLAANLNTLQSDHPLRVLIGQRAREYVEKHHDSNKIALDFQAIYRKC